MTWIAKQDTPLGPVLLACRETALTGLWLDGQRYYPRRLAEEAPFQPEHPVFQQTFRWLDRYFAGQRPECGELPLQPEGTAFQRGVWALLRQIPYGETVTYGQLAAEAAVRLGRSAPSPRAVGSAVGRNPISIILPCHRVVGANGSLTGYAGGLERKRWLLRHEGAL